MTRVFISYRRADSAGYAGRLYEHLAPHLDADSVFMDIDSIPLGADFVQVIESTLARVNTVLVLIGPHWLSVTDASGRRRLDDPNDYVRMEIAAALSNPDKRVIPVLVNDATMPSADQLPDNLKPLARRNAIELGNLEFPRDVARLAETLRSHAPASPDPGRRPSPHAAPPPATSSPIPEQIAPPAHPSILARAERRKFWRWRAYLAIYTFLPLLVFSDADSVQSSAIINVVIIAVISLLMTLRGMYRDKLWAPYWIILHIGNILIYASAADPGVATIIYALLAGAFFGMLQIILLSFAHNILRGAVRFYKSVRPNKR